MVFGILGVVVAATELSKSNKDRINTSSTFNSFKNNYLFVYSLMMGKPSRSHLNIISLNVNMFIYVSVQMYVSGFAEFLSDLMVLVSFLRVLRVPKWNLK